MPTYAFILGRKHLLSIAELCSTIADSNDIFDIKWEALVAKFSKPLRSPQQTLNRLGGTIKIAEIFAEIPLNQKDKIAQTIGDYLKKKFEDASSKIRYGVSIYNIEDRHENFLKKILIFIKKFLTKNEIKSRFINHNFKNLENAAIQGEKLLQDGAEIVIIQGNKSLYIGETKALQDFENYSKRDYDRPGRDPHLGMLPPKLAQIMINLTGLTTLEQPVPGAKTIYDSFCGVGTVLTEGLLMGYKVIGSDVKPEVITKSEENIHFTLKNFSQTKENQKTAWRLFQQDATKITKTDLPEAISAVVTETFLGPPVSKFPSSDQVQKTFTNIRWLVSGFLKAIHPLLKNGTPVVFSLLVYRQQQRFVFIERLAEEVEKIGYEVVPLIPASILQKHGLQAARKPTLVYDRPDQIVGREIWKLMVK